MTTMPLIDAKNAYNEFIATVPEAIRWKVDGIAHDNVFAVEATSRDRSGEPEAWDEALATARMVMDAPADYGIEIEETKMDDGIELTTQELIFIRQALRAKAQNARIRANKGGPTIIRRACLDTERRADELIDKIESELANREAHEAL